MKTTTLMLLFLVSCSSTKTPPKATYNDNIPTAKVSELILNVKSDMRQHPGFERIRKRHGSAKIYVADILIKTKKELPSKYITQEVINSMPIEFEYVPERIRLRLNAKASYEVDGMVDEETLDLINRKSAPDVLIYGYITDNETEQGSLYSLHLFAMDIERRMELVQIRSQILVEDMK
jgi:PBP1b-binding outer membrane lipoprotein LpoB